MAYTLNELIGWDAIQEVVQTPLGGVATTPSLNALLGLTRPINGLMAEWLRTANSRQTAPFNDHGAQSRAMDQQSIVEVAVKCMHALNHITFKGELLSALRSFGNLAVQERASEVIDYQTIEFKRQHMNARNAALCSAFTLNNIYTDAKGNILPSSSGATRTVAWGANFANGSTTTATPISATGTLAYNSVFPDGSTGGDWSTASTDISAWLAGLQSLALQKSGRRITRAIYGSAIPGYMRANTILANWSTGAYPGSIGDSLTKNVIPQGAFYDGISWESGSTLGFQDSGGTYRYWVPASYVLFLPEPDRSWFEIQEGSEEVPTGLGMFDDAPSAIRGGLRTANGMYAACRIPDKPPAVIEEYMGDNYMPALKDSNAFFYAKVIA